MIRFADCELDISRRTLTRSGEQVQIEPQVFDLLHLLAQKPEQLVTRDEIVEAVWGGRIVSESAISARIAAARKAVGDDGKSQSIIRTVARRGLEMVAPVEILGSSSPESSKHHEQRIRYTKTTKGENIAYSITGEGPLLVRIGYGSSDLEAEWHSEILREPYEELSKNFKLLRMDNVGFGLSAKELDTMSVQPEVDNALRVADAAGFDTFSVFSESGGCMEAMYLASHYPDRVNSLVMLGAYAEGRVARTQAKEPDPLRALISQGWDKQDGSFARAFVLTYFPETPIEKLAEVITMMQEAGSSNNWLLKRDMFNAASAMDWLGDIKCPTLIINGRGDNVHPLDQARKLAAGIENSELYVVETANHFCYFGHPKWPEVRDRMTEFMLRYA